MGKRHRETANEEDIRSKKPDDERSMNPDDIEKKERKKMKKKRSSEATTASKEIKPQASKGAKKNIGRERSGKKSKREKKRGRDAEVEGVVSHEGTVKQSEIASVKAGNSADHLGTVNGTSARSSDSDGEGYREREPVLKKKKTKRSDKTKKARDAEREADVEGPPESQINGDNGVSARGLDDRKRGNDALNSGVEEIGSKGSLPRKAFLHGYAALSLPNSEQVKMLNATDQQITISTRAALCERIMDLLHDTIVAGNQWTKSESKDDATAMEEALTNDLIRLKMVPLAKQYVEMTLWKRVERLTREQLRAASKLGFGKGSAVKGTMSSQGSLLHRDDDPDAEFVSYREAYMKTVVDRYRDDLEKMRLAEDMDVERVQFLLRCLDSGASLFANLKCMELREQGIHN